MIRIVAHHFVAGIEPGRLAAPIIRYMTSWSVERIYAYCRRKGWSVENLETETPIMSTLTPNLNKALAKAISEASTVIEDRKVEAQAPGSNFKGFGYASSEAIIQEARDVLTKNGLVVYPTEFKVVLNETVDFLPIGATTKFTKVVPQIRRKYILAHASGEEKEFLQDAAIYDDGKKGADKGVSAADTTSLAYFLRNLLLLPRLSKEEFLERERQEREREPLQNPGAPMQSAPVAGANTNAAVAATQQTIAKVVTRALAAPTPTAAEQAAAHAANVAALEKDAKAKEAAAKAAAPGTLVPPIQQAAPKADTSPAFVKRQSDFAKMVQQIQAYHLEQGTTVADFETALNRVYGAGTLIKSGKFQGREILTEEVMKKIEGEVHGVKGKDGKATFGLAALIPAGAAA